MPSDLTPEQRVVYDSIAHGPRASTPVIPITDDQGRLLGPFGLMTIAPAIGDAVQGVGAAIRFAGTLSALVRETAILTVAAHFRCDFEWFAHRAAALDAGLDDIALEAIRSTGPAVLDDPAATARAAVLDVLQTGRLSDETYAQAVARFGAEGLAELVWLTGYYAMLAMALGAFDPELPSAVHGQFSDRA